MWLLAVTTIVEVAPVQFVCARAVTVDAANSAIIRNARTWRAIRIASPADLGRLRSEDERACFAFELVQPRRGALFGAGCSSSSYEIKPAFTSSGKGTTDHIKTYNAASAVIVDQNQTA